LKRVTKAALGGVAGCALVLGATQWAAGASDLTTLSFARRLIDVQSNSGPFDGAKAKLQISETTTGSTFTIQISGIDPSAAEAGKKFGAHVHTGTCVKRDFGPPGGMAAGPHYKNDPDPLKPVSRENEVWFDLEPNEDGTAIDETYVPFTVDPGAEKERAVVIHVKPTDESTGGAGERQACLPLDYEDLQ
jgi:Cu/Zn superoxide dismutase